jgi:hypothetical protein
MSITAAELIQYLAANKPVADNTTVGGAIDATMRVQSAQFSVAAVVSIQSSGADVRTAAIIGRLATGAYTTETVTLNGTTPVLSVNTYLYLLSVILSTSNSNTVTVKQGSGGTTIQTIPANEVGFQFQFVQSASGSGTLIRYDKSFFKNTDATITLNNATVTLTADSTSTLMIGLGAALNDSLTAANRLTAPAGVAFSGVNVALTVPSGATIPAASAIGIWTQQTLTAGAGPYDTTYTVQLAGTTI